MPSIRPSTQEPTHPSIPASQHPSIPASQHPPATPHHRDLRQPASSLASSCCVQATPLCPVCHNLHHKAHEAPRGPPDSTRCGTTPSMMPQKHGKRGISVAASGVRHAHAHALPWHSTALQTRARGKDYYSYGSAIHTL
ncbi:hypothetical protein EX30DRAFT_391227 [Ascodesmis nigricans]|uniref:Uncharacterized protein n=1 Tax=Ascodesmis nigricans TaxID=341454 RepID=A0A4S2MXW5_9PEZI|nr:hypothetical protein EX30DRAFT_391227 [Ascodesmis nigricans]